jgi:hypothetical protein
MTATTRTQRILDAATEHGWLVEPEGEDKWLVHPPSEPIGYIVCNHGSKGCRIVSQRTNRPVTQKDVLSFLTDAQFPDGVDLSNIATTEGVLVFNGEDITRLIERLTGQDKPQIEVPEEEKASMSEYCHGSMLASQTMAALVDECVAAGRKATADAPDAEISSRSGANAWLTLAMQTFDPFVLARIFHDQPEPSDQQQRGAVRVVSSCKRSFELCGRSIYAQDPEGKGVVPVKEFLDSMEEFARTLRETADECFGEHIVISDADLEGLLA